MASFGIRCKDSNGKVTLDLTDRITRILGRVTVDTVNGSSGTINIPSDLGGGTAFVLFDAMSTNWQRVNNRQYNSVSISGNTINYSNCISSFYYGMY